MFRSRSNVKFKPALVALASLACLGSGSMSRAQFQILVAEAAAPPVLILDNGPLDTDLVSGIILANTGALNTLLVNFKVNQLYATSNSLGGAPLSNQSASLFIKGDFQRSSTEGIQSISIQSVDNGFLFPAADPKTMTIGAADVYFNTTRGDSRSFQGFFDPANTLNPGAGVSSPLLAFIPSAGAGPFTSSNPGVNTALGAQPLPFALSNITTLVLGPSTASTAMQRDVFGGTVTISANGTGNQVPEPGAASLLLCGGVAAAGLRRWRRK